MPDLQRTGYLEPWDVTLPGVEQFYPGLWDLYSAGAPDPLSPEQQVAPMTPAQRAAMGRLGAWGETGTGAGLEDFATTQLGAGLNMDEVAGYADNPMLDDAIQAALRDPFRQLTEQTLPGLSLGSAMTGNTGSTRAAMAEGIAGRGYADRASDVAANMRYGAYRDALNTAMGTRGQDLNYARLAEDIGLGNIDALLYGGSLEQEQEQRLRDAAQGNWQYGVESPWWQAENYARLVSPPSATFGTQYGEDMTPDFQDILLGGLTQGGLSWLGDQFTDFLGGLGAGSDLDELFNNPGYF